MSKIIGASSPDACGNFEKKTLRQKRRGTKTQRRKEVSSFPELLGPFDESPAGRAAYLGGGTDRKASMDSAPLRLCAFALLSSSRAIQWIVICLFFSAGILSADTGLEGFPPIYENWETITTADGLPNNHIFWVEFDDVRKDRVWLGTDKGLAGYHIKDRSIEVFTPADGLGHQAVMSVAVDPVTGNIWAATFGGLSLISGGKVVKNFTQVNSGLANDVVFAVIVEGRDVWAATTAGTSRYNIETGEWKIYSSLNMPTDENWCYNLSSGGGKVFIAAWGGGIIEYDVAKDHFRHYIDPDGEFEIELFPNDGLVHNITTSPSFESGLLWATTYFGLSVYDFRRWRSYFDHDSGLASNFINFGRAKPGTHDGWICTDKGLSVLNHDTNKWVTYTTNDQPDGKGVIELWDGATKVEVREIDPGIAHKFILSVDFSGDDVWVGTANGLSHGTLVPTKPAK